MLTPRIASLLRAAPMLLVAACELKENAPPPAAIVDTPMAARAPRVDTVRIIDTVTVTRVDTVYVPETVVDLPARRATKSSTIVPPPAPADPVDKADLAYLKARKLMIPVPGVTVAKLPDTFREKRGTREHAAMDIMAPRGTPVISADAGLVKKLHTSVGGGLTLYLADPTGRYIYYYAHLDRYKQGIKEGDRVEPGDLLGYVGTTGNAPPNAPHLHFAIGRMDDEKHWWKWTPIDPRPLLTRVAVTPKE